MIHTWKCRWNFLVCASVCMGLCLRTWGWACVRRALSTYVGLISRMWDTWQRPYFAYFPFPFSCFTSICNPNTSFCHFCIRSSLHPSCYLHSCIENIIFHYFRLNQESNVIFFFCNLHLLMLEEEALTRWWSDTTPSFPKGGLTFGKQASSLSLAFCQKGSQVLP